MNRERVLGHIAALFTITVWGATFVATKVLLRCFSPTEILFIRFLVAYLFLWMINPRPLILECWRDEVPFAAAGACGITIYYLVENISLMYTKASNVSIIVSTAPFFIAIIYYLLGNRDERPDWKFFVGFVAAILGVSILSLSKEGFTFSPKGDGLALIAAIAWGFYSYFVKCCANRGYRTLQITRRCFMYGLLFILPVLPFTGFSVSISDILVPLNLMNLVFLGLIASAICFVTWNFAVKRLGAVASGVYIYLNPVTTVFVAYFTIGEKMTMQTFLGMALVMSGLVLSEI